MKILNIFFTITVLSCNTSKDRAAKQLLDFGNFTIEVPSSWKKMTEKGVDSYVGGIAIDSTDTIHFDLGFYSNDLSEYIILQEAGIKSYVIKENPDEYIIKTDSLSIDSLVKSSITWERKENRKLKIVTPKKTGVGTTGIYIDSLWKVGNSNYKFNMYGINLKPLNEANFLKAIETLKFVRK